MSLTSTPFNTVSDAPFKGSLRKTCAVGAVVLIHCLFFYGFTHRNEMVKIVAPVSTVLLNIQDIKPSPPPPQPAPPKDVKLEPTPIETPIPEVPPIEQEVAPPMDAPVEAVSTAPISDAPPMVSLDTIHILRKSEPVYPAAERRAGHEGRVVLKLFIGSDGKTTAIEVVQSSGYSALDEAALSAVKNWRFGGNKTGGVVSVLLPISFKLS